MQKWKIYLNQSYKWKASFQSHAPKISGALTTSNELLSELLISQTSGKLNSV